jgi:hypothetical protein
MTRPATVVVVLILTIGSINGFVFDLKQPKRRGALLRSVTCKLTSNNSNDNNNNNNIIKYEEKDSSLVQSSGSLNYGNIIPPVDWKNTVINNDNKMKKGNRRPAPTDRSSSIQGKQGRADHTLFFATTNENKMTGGAGRQSLQWEEDNRWERTRRREDNMWERARRKAIQQRVEEEEDAIRRNNDSIIPVMTVSSDASETGTGQATTTTTSKKGSTNIAMIYETTKRLELEGIDQARIVASTDENPKWKDENELSIVALPIQEEVSTKESDRERASASVGVGGSLSNWWGRLRKIDEKPDNWWGRLRTPIKTKSLYDVLDCPPDATREQLKRSYLSLARETHPDAIWQKSGMIDTVEHSEEENSIVLEDKSKTTVHKFTEISQAWKILGDPSSRRRYDRELQARGVTDTAAFLFEGLVMGAARTLDAVLASAEDNL